MLMCDSSAALCRLVGRLCCICGSLVTLCMINKQILTSCKRSLDKYYIFLQFYNSHDHSQAPGRALKVLILKGFGSITVVFSSILLKKMFAGFTPTFF